MTAAATMTTPEAQPASEIVTEEGFPTHLLTLDRYLKMVEAGIFDEKEPIFLWKGRLVEKMTKGMPHNNGSAAINTAMVRVVPVGWHVRPEQPVAMFPGSMPEPDLTVVRSEIRDYPLRYPTPGDVALVVEVADSSLRMDSGEVMEAYARGAIPVYWIVNIPRRRIEVYSRPTGPADRSTYLERREFGLGDEIPVVLDGREVGRIAASDVLI